MARFRMMLLVAFGLLFLANTTLAAENGWQVFRKTAPSVAQKTARIFNFDLPEAPPVVLDRVITREDLAEIATITLRGHFRNEPAYVRNFHADKDDIVFVSAEEGEFWSATVAFTGIFTIESGAIILYDAPYDSDNPILTRDYLEGIEPEEGVVVLTMAEGATGTIGTPGGEFVNFSGSLWIPRPGESSHEMRTGSIGLNNVGGTLEIHSAVFSQHQSGLSGMVSGGASGVVTDVTIDATDCYFINNRHGIYVGHDGTNWEGGKDKATRVRIANPYFAGNQMSVEPLYIDAGNDNALMTRTSVELVNVYFGPGQSPTATWDTSSVRDLYASVFSVTEPTPTALGQIRVIQTWPRPRVFALADFDRDDTVGPEDLAMVAEATGDSINTDLFTWRYDLDGDSVIGLGDFREMFRPYTGRSMTEPIADLARDSRVREFVTTLAGYDQVVTAAESDPFLGPILNSLRPTAVTALDNATPASWLLGQNYPNPFNAETTIEYQIAAATNVTVAVYDLPGQRVATLVSARQAPGVYRITWDGRTDTGSALSSGTYFYRLEAGGYAKTNRLTLLR